MQGKIKKTVYAIPSDAAFLDALAEGLIAKAGGDNLKLADQLVFLPTRRSAVALREAFLKKLNAAALLPRMQPLGDIDEEELYFAESAEIDIPPAIDPLRRQLLLTRLVAATDKEMPLDQAAQLAKALGEFLDQVQLERCDLKNLEGLVERKDLAEHWRQTVKFLEILTGAWPALLAEEGCIDPGDRQNRVLAAQAEIWQKNPPSFPVIAAGTTGSIPATADLLDIIAGLPSGMVVLPGLDKEISEDAWKAIDESHPQYGMKKLLEKFGIGREEVQDWPSAGKAEGGRTRLLQTAMLPAAATGEWRRLDKETIPARAAAGLSRIELDHPQEEAQAIALLMRHALEVPHKTATLVTPDRDLAGRVLALLKRWDIEANDSAGSSLATLPVGAFLSDILAAASPAASNVDYLSLLKHPFAAFGMEPGECRAHAREVELQVFRQERPAKNEWLERFLAALQPLTSNWNKPQQLSERILAHIRLAELLAASDEESGAERLWTGDGGEAAAEWLDNWRKAAPGFPPVTGEEYQGLFLKLLAAVRVRPRFGQHPRLSILGPLEARLIQSDLTIIGGLNEGTWPPETPIDPWMSRPMKKDFGLPTQERRTGLSAHDFVQLASAPEVVLTRSKRSGNAPTVPSRFLLQLETVLEALGYSGGGKDALALQKPWAEWARMIDVPEKIAPCAAPAPRPPAAARPRELSVTEIGPWRRNPYAIYAKYILGLKKLEPLDEEVDASDRGVLIHDALESFMKEYGKAWPQDALGKLLAAGRKVFVAHEAHPEVRAFWWPRFERIAAWFVHAEEARQAEGKKNLMAEAKGRITLGSFTLKGRADRIDALPSGGVEIIDYKTGGLPTQKDVAAGYEPQLPLLALIAEQGGFEGIKPAKAAELSYWKLSGGAEAGKMQPIKGDPAQLAAEARQGLENLIEKFADEKTPYRAVPKAKLAPRYDDYAHLARLAEWGRTAGEE